jgi:hypothetical protein
MLDLSGSMYRFNGFDGRLTRVCEIAAMVWRLRTESFDWAAMGWLVHATAV